MTRVCAGTERTDSDALGRLPHAGGPAASEYTDSMDVDIDMGGASQGGVSQRQGGTVSMVTAGASAVWVGKVKPR